ETESILLTAKFVRKFEDYAHLAAVLAPRERGASTAAKWRSRKHLVSSAGCAAWREVHGRCPEERRGHLPTASQPIDEDQRKRSGYWSGPSQSRATTCRNWSAIPCLRWMAQTASAACPCNCMEHPVATASVSELAAPACDVCSMAACGPQPAA